MKVKITRGVTQLQLCVDLGTDSIAEVVPAHLAVIEYASGSCVLVQADGWQNFIIMQRVGRQYPEEVIERMIGQLKELDVTDPICILHDLPEPDRSGDYEIIPENL